MRIDPSDRDRSVELAAKRLLDGADQLTAALLADARACPTNSADVLLRRVRESEEPG